jgi:hypothetical protein
MLVALHPASREDVLRTLREIEFAAHNANDHSGNSRIYGLQPSDFLPGVGDEPGSDAAAASTYRQHRRQPGGGQLSQRGHCRPRASNGPTRPGSEPLWGRRMIRWAGS